AALLPLAQREGRQVVWAVRTGTETDRPVEELKAVSRLAGRRVFGLSLRGRKDMCLLWRGLKVRGGADSEDFTFLCRTHREDCKYLANLNLKASSLQGFAETPRLYSETLKYCEEREVCPYMLQLHMASVADVVALSYNYVIDEGVSWALRRWVDYGNSFLVVDEAHNLQTACSNLNSDRVTLGTIRSAIQEAGRFQSAQAKEVEGFLRSMHEYFLKSLEGISEDDVEFDVKGCVAYSGGSLEAFEAYVQTMRRLGIHVRRQRLAEGKAPRSSLYRLGGFWASALKNLGVEGIAFLASKEKKRNLAVEMWDMRASRVLGDVWRGFHRCLFCSGTIKPIEAFAEIIGLDDYSGKAFPSPFTERNALSLITEGLTTEGEELQADMAEAYVAAINSFVGSLNVNMAVFSASYRVQDTLLKHGLKEAVKGKGRRFFLEHQGMTGRESRRVLESFKACSYSDEKGVLCATMTGRYAEGADFPGKELEGVFLAGIPFDRMTTRTRLYLEYYRRLYGREKGTFYAYILPALKRASQSLGRALRSREDRAVFILGDRRYRRFISLLPDFVQRNVKAVKGGAETLNREIENFWDRQSKT
ncbi:MAG: ATP-dependent DNA helicase, partial [Candidatus Bathyarchaeia archaeon]